MWNDRLGAWNAAGGSGNRSEMIDHKVPIHKALPRPGNAKDSCIVVAYHNGTQRVTCAYRIVCMV